MSRILLVFICSLVFCASSLAQVSFEKKALDELLLDKPIFVDVYTTWCGPCKKLDRTTFQDSLLSQFMNDNFTCLKWDAEAEGFKDLAEKYNVNAYPTLLFLNNKGELVNRSEGFLNAKELIERAERVVSFIEHNPLEGIHIPSLSLAESTQLLSDLSEFDTPEKMELFNHLIGLIGNSDSLWRANSDWLSLNATNETELTTIEKLISYQEPLSIYSKRTIKTLVSVERSLTDVLDSKLEGAKKAGDYALYRKIALLKGELKKASKQANMPFDYDKQYQSDRLDYYKYHSVKERYKPLADSLVEKYILPHSPDKVKAADRRESKYMSKFLKKAKLDYLEEVEVDSNSVEFFKSQYRSCFKMADRLDDIANDLMAIYHDEEVFMKALEYTNLAYDYIALPKYLITKAKIQFKLGLRDNANETLMDVKNHIYFDEKAVNIDELLEK